MINEIADWATESPANLFLFVIIAFMIYFALFLPLAVLIGKASHMADELDRPGSNE